MRARIALLTLVAAGLAAAPAHAGKISSGEIVVGQGANGVTLGMTRPEVVSAVGEPLDENRFGVMSYQPSTSAADGIFDVYRREDNEKYVDLIVVAFPGSGKWVLDDGNKIFKRGAIKRLYDTYGGRIKQRTDETLSKNLVIKGRFKGRKVETSFLVDKYSRTRGHVLDVFIVFLD